MGRPHGACNRARTLVPTSMSPSPPLMLSPRATMQRRMRALPTVAAPQSARTNDPAESRLMRRPVRRTSCSAQPDAIQDVAPKANEGMEAESTSKEAQEGMEVERAAREVQEGTDVEKASRGIQHGLEEEQTNENEDRKAQEGEPRRPCELALTARRSTSNEYDWLRRLAHPSDFDEADMQPNGTSSCTEEHVEPKLKTDPRKGIFPVEEVDGEGKGWAEEPENCGRPSMKITFMDTGRPSMKSTFRSTAFMRTTDKFWRNYEKEDMEHERPAWNRDDHQLEIERRTRLFRKRDEGRLKMQRLIGMRDIAAATRQALSLADVKHGNSELSTQPSGAISRQTSGELSCDISFTGKCTKSNPFGVVEEKRSAAAISLEIMSTRRHELSDARKALEKVIVPRECRARRRRQEQKMREMKAMQDLQRS